MCAKISPFSTVFSKDLHCTQGKTRACLGKGFKKIKCDITSVICPYAGKLRFPRETRLRLVMDKNGTAGVWLIRVNLKGNKFPPDAL